MNGDEQDIYEQHVMRHFEEPYHRGTIGWATHRHRQDNPLCGDSVQIDLVIDRQGCVAEAWFHAAGCCISQAAASMLVEKIEGMTVMEVAQFGATEMMALFRARLTPLRQNCCLLPWRTLQTALRSPVTH